MCKFRTHLFIILVSSTISYSQQVTIYKNGNPIKTKVFGSSEYSLYTTTGTFRFNEFDSMRLNDGDKSGFNELLVRMDFARHRLEYIPNFEVLLNKKFKFDLPFDENDELVYKEIVSISRSQSQLFERANFFMKTLASFRLEDDLLIAYWECSTKTEKYGPLFNDFYKIKFKATIQCKENRYRYAISDFIIYDYKKDLLNPSIIFNKSTYPDPTNERRKQLLVINDLIQQEVIAFSISLKKAMYNDPKSGLKSNDW